MRDGPVVLANQMVEEAANTRANVVLVRSDSVDEAPILLPLRLNINVPRKRDDLIVIPLNLDPFRDNDVLHHSKTSGCGKRQSLSNVCHYT